ncbi:MAG TPA: SDR family oxidoreductase, partial [Tahibacter sp.]|nr:SDR family oxidoreductase [Tahibacter sp.]
MQQTVLVIGAAGGVGHGISAYLIATGYAVVAVGRQRDTLLKLAARLGEPEALTLLPASVESDVAAQALLRELRDLRRRYVGVVVAIGSPRRSGRLLDQDEVFLDDKLHADVVSHYIAARHLIPFLAETSPGALYLGIGSAAAEFPWAGYGHHSVTSAAQRMLARVLHDESRGLAVRVQHLSLGGVVRTHL